MNSCELYALDEALDYLNETNYINENLINTAIEFINEAAGKEICYNTPINEEYVIVNEIYFSKKDLQDPKTLEKLLDKAKKEKDIKKKLDYIFTIFSFIAAILATIGIGVASGSVITGLSLFVPIILASLAFALTVIIKLDKVMFKIHESRIKKLRKKAEELRDKAKKSKQNQIASNCQKLIDAIDKYYKDLETEKFNNAVDAEKEFYENLVNIIHGKSYMEEPDIEYFIYAKILKIPAERINKGQASCKDALKDTDTVLEYFFGTSKVEEIKKDGKYDEYLKLCNIIPEFKTPDRCKISCYYAIDDTIFIYSKMANLFYYGEYKVEWSEWNSDISKLANNYMSEKDINMDALKVADANLGYYRLSTPPEGVTPKKI